MPILQTKQIDSSVSYCVWQITEAEEFFFSRLRLASADEQYIRSQKLPVRRLEKLACRAAVAHLLETDSVTLSYRSDGVPQLDGFYLSFSHCKNYSAVALSSVSPVGVDIETIGERILKLSHRFLNNRELVSFDLSNSFQMHFCWGAKEALYKAAPHKISNYVDDLQVLGDFPHCFGRINLNPRSLDLKLYSEVIDGQMLVVCH